MALPRFCWGGIAHLGYAAAVAFDPLEEQIREFNFDQAALHHAYANMSPARFLEIIDGFLSESHSLVPGGNRHSLNQLREFVESRVQPVFDTGCDAGRNAWQDSSQEFGQAEPEVLRAAARKVAPQERPDSEWFVEGYCQGWAKAEFDSEVEYLRKSSEP